MSQQLQPAHPLEKRVILAGVEEPQSWTLAVFENKLGGYKASRKAVGMEPDAIVGEVKASGLRGLGGAGFATGVKWSFIPKNPTKPVYLVCNADEGEPGTFKDRQIMEHMPHRLVEGMICAASAIRSETGYIYIRGELRLAIERMKAAVAEAYKAGYLGKNIFGSGRNFDLTVHPGAGAYICGEETGLIESLEGDRGQPRLKPPFPAISGAFGGPTIVNNVETLSHVPGILNNGADWFIKLGNGTPRGGGSHLLCISGDVQRPGFYELPVGINLKTVLNDVCGGPLPGRSFKACYPGGSSSPLLTADEFDVAMDFDSLAAKGTMAGSGAIIVMDDRRSIPEMAMRTARFYAHESCGQCVPCREGTKWVYSMTKRLCKGEGTKKDIQNILDACNNMAGKTICVLSDACAMPVTSMLKKFRGEFEAIAKNENEVTPALPKVSGQMGGLMAAIRERQNKA
ncbi:MAG: NADH-quinone oxidoreductase subunit NuoF [Bdellovibrionales bacterium]|nr:NADH-quinone oxidoreductase subunit NuoF [Bdellovibrionales bacterium]